MEAIANTLENNDLNYVKLIPYNGTSPTGGNSLTEDLNVYFQVCRDSRSRGFASWDLY